MITWTAPWIDPEPDPVSPMRVETLITTVSERKIDRALILTSFHQSPLPLALLLRLAGVVVTGVGILIVRGVLPGYAWAGVVIILIGLVDVFVVPQMLAKKWRTPPE